MRLAMCHVSGEGVAANNMGPTTEAHAAKEALYAGVHESAVWEALLGKGGHIS